MVFFSRFSRPGPELQPRTTEESVWPTASSTSVLSKLKPPRFVEEIFRRKRINSLSPEEVSRSSVESLVSRGGKYGRAETPVSLATGWRDMVKKPIVVRLLKPQNRLYSNEEYVEKVRSVSAEYIEKTFLPKLVQKEEEFAEIVALRALYNVRLSSETCKYTRSSRDPGIKSGKDQKTPQEQTELKIDKQTIAQLQNVAVTLKSQASERIVTLPLSQAYQLVVRRSASARDQVSQSSQESRGVWRVQAFDFSDLPTEAAKVIQVASLVNVFQDHSIRKGPLRYIPSAWLAQVMAGYVEMDLPIPFGLPLFPRKVQSGVKSRVSLHPDAGEASTLARLNAIPHALNLLYPPMRECNSQNFTERVLTQRRGAVAVALMDGGLFLKCSNVPEETVVDYERDIQDLASLMKLHRNVVLMPFQDIEKLVPRQFIEKRDQLIEKNEREWGKRMLPLLNRYFPATPTGLPLEGDLRAALERAIVRDPTRNSEKKPRGVFEDVFLARLFSLKYDCIELYCKTNELDQAEFEVSFFKKIFDVHQEPELEKLRWEVIRESWKAQIKFLALVDARKVVDPLSLIDPLLLELDYARTLATGESSSKRLELEYSERTRKSLIRKVTQLMAPDSIYPNFKELDLNRWGASLPDGTPLLQQIWRIMLRCSIHPKQFHIGLNLTTSSERTYQSWQGVPFLRYSFRDEQHEHAPRRHRPSELSRDFNVVLDGTFAIEAEGGFQGYPLVVNSSSEYQNLPLGDPRRYLERIASSKQIFLYMQHDPDTDPGGVDGYLTFSLERLDRQRSKGGKGRETDPKPAKQPLALAGSEDIHSLSDAVRDFVGSSESEYLVKQAGWLCESIGASLLADLHPTNPSATLEFRNLLEDLDGLSGLEELMVGIAERNSHFSGLTVLSQAYLLSSIKETFQGEKFLTLLDRHRQEVIRLALAEQPKVISMDSVDREDSEIEPRGLVQAGRPHLHLMSQLRGVAFEIAKLGTLLTQSSLEEGILYIHERRLLERLTSISGQIEELY